LPTLFNEVVRGKRDLGDWNLPPAPYIFPEYILFGLAYLTADNVTQSLLNYAAIQIMITALLVGWLMRSLHRSRDFILTLSSTATLLMVVAESVYLQRTSIMNTAYHYGTALICLLLCGIIVNQAHSVIRHTGQQIILTGLIAFAIISDSLFLTQGWIPFLLVMTLRASNRREILYLIWFFAVGIFSYTQAENLIPNRMGTEVSFIVDLNHINLVVSKVFSHLKANPYEGFQVLAAVILAPNAIYKKIHTHTFYELRSNKNVSFLIFSLASMLLTIVGFCFVDVGFEERRYIITTHLFSMLIILSSLVSITSIKASYALALFLTISIFYFKSTENRVLIKEYYPNWLYCVDNYIPIGSDILSNYGPEKVLKNYSKSVGEVTQVVLENGRFAISTIITSTPSTQRNYRYAVSDLGGHSFANRDIHKIYEVKRTIDCGEVQLYEFEHGVKL
jgi:hypothetical protein